MLHFYTQIQRLSKGIVTNRVFDLRDDLHYFFEEHKQTNFFDWSNYKNDIARFAYFIDIFEQLNKINV